MRKLVVAPMFVAALSLAGCGTSNQGGSSAATASSQAAGAPAPAATVVTGTVTLADPSVKVSRQATLELSLVDVSKQPGITVNKQDFSPPTFPQSFRIPFSTSAINAKDLYVVQAVMENGDRTYSTRLQKPVLTRGQPATVELKLVAEPTPAEKMLENFEQAKRQTGGMQVKTGTGSKIGESRSWQVFSNTAGIQFIIEQVNNADTGFTKTQYAYRNGLPWVLVQEHMPKPQAAADSTKRVGWDDNGVVVLSQHEADGKTEKLSDAQTKALHQHAEDEYSKFDKKH